MKRIAQGNTAEIYEYGENLICKLYYPEYPSDYIKHEFYNATVVWKLGIRTPKAHKLIVDNGREGIVYDRIIGEELYHKLNEESEMPSGIWLDKFVEFHKQLLQYRVNDAMSYKDFLKMFSTDKETIARTYFLLGYDTDVQSEYLERMGYTLEDIMPYLDVISAIRENEMKR